MASWCARAADGQASTPPAGHCLGRLTEGTQVLAQGLAQAEYSKPCRQALRGRPWRHAMADTALRAAASNPAILRALECHQRVPGGHSPQRDQRLILGRAVPSMERCHVGKLNNYDPAGLLDCVVLL